jgi:hypothetical protein
LSIGVASFGANARAEKRALQQLAMCGMEPLQMQLFLPKLPAYVAPEVNQQNGVQELSIWGTRRTGAQFCSAAIQTNLDMAAASKIGAPGEIRTHDLCLRRAALYPAELRVPKANAAAP